jgi:beta-phosphoglucomutase-like phosphatase (HAD superfamily)
VLSLVRCVVIEDSIVGLKAAKSAGMRCIITYTDSTASEDFYGLGADAKVPNLDGVTLSR